MNTQPSVFIVDDDYAVRDSIEMEILPLALAGIHNKEMARLLNISYRTIETHRIRILKKTETANFLKLSQLYENFRFPIDSDTRGLN